MSQYSYWQNFGQNRRLNLVGLSKKNRNAGPIDIRKNRAYDVAAMPVCFRFPGFLLLVQVDKADTRLL